MRTLNLGIVAHVDAGKTSLTERLLHAAGVIDAVGRVDDGTTRTDTMALERERGITIRSAVVSFEVGSTIVNLIDTPGHPDFIAEVDRVIGLLDGAVLVVSAVEGVQAQTRVLMRALRRLGVPTLIFVNKVDRMGADSERTVAMIRSRLSADVIVLGDVTDAGLPGATCRWRSAEDAAFADEIWTAVADHDRRVMEQYVTGPPPAPATLRRELRRATRRGALHPIMFGSAITGAGVAELLGAIPDLLPSRLTVATGRPDGIVFKVERSPTGERTAIVRLTSGALRTRDRLTIDGKPRAVTRLDVFERGSHRSVDCVGAGRIARVGGLGPIRIGDRLRGPNGDAIDREHRHDDPTGQRENVGASYFAPPQYSAVVAPADPTQRRALGEALTVLADEDPLIALRHDDIRGELAVSLHGEVQREVIAETLRREFGLEVVFGDVSIICTERVLGSGEASATISRRTQTWPFLAGLGIRIEALPPGQGVEIDAGIAPGRLPAAFVTAAIEGVRGALATGPHGWEVTDCRATITASSYYPRQSRMHGTFDKNMSTVANDFRLLAPLLVARACRQAGTEVLAPVHRLHLEAPTDTANAVTRLLMSLHATIDGHTILGDRLIVAGAIPVAQMQELRQRLPGLTAGDSFVESTFEGYRPSPLPPPTRPRPSPDPYDQVTYVREIADRL